MSKFLGKAIMLVILLVFTFIFISTATSIGAPWFFIVFAILILVLGVFSLLRSR